VDSLPPPQTGGVERARPSCAVATARPQAATLALLALGARVPQILLNARRGDAGVLSGATAALNVAGCAVRAFTTATLTQDGLLLAGCLVQGVLCSIILAQVLRSKPAVPATASGAA
jgi:hypothetical protein